MSFDDDVERFLDCCKEAIGPDAWSTRLEAAQRFDENLPLFADKKEACFIPTINPEDPPGWFLYQAKTYANEPQLCDIHFAARLIPKLKRIGIGLDSLLGMKGFHDKLMVLLNPASKSIENILNEMLVALRYSAADFTGVEFIKEQSHKTPDLLVRNRNREMFVECKRLSKESDYAVAEREKWYRLSHRLRSDLKAHKISQVFDIVFHKELQSYPDDYLYRKLHLLIGSPVSGLQIDNDELTVSVRPSNIGRIERYLEDNSIRCDSTMLFEMLFDLRDPRKGITYAIYYKPHYKYSKYISEIDWAFATIWYCDSPVAFDRKARGMKRHIAKAVSQIPAKGIGAVHLTIESYDGSDVELRILQRLYNDLQGFTTGEVSLPVLYLHLLRFYVPPNENWEVTEDCFYLSRPRALKWIILAEPHLVTRSGTTL